MLLFLSFMVFLVQSQRTERQNRLRGVGVGTCGREEVGGKGIGQKMCTHVCKWKYDTIETVPGNCG
jgi:hypothetical protein